MRMKRHVLCSLSKKDYRGLSYFVAVSFVCLMNTNPTVIFRAVLEIFYCTCTEMPTCKPQKCNIVNVVSNSKQLRTIIVSNATRVTAQALYNHRRKKC